MGLIRGSRWEHRRPSNRKDGVLPSDDPKGGFDVSRLDWILR